MEPHKSTHRPVLLIGLDFPPLHICHRLGGLHDRVGLGRKTIKEKQERSKVREEVLASFLAVRFSKRRRRPREEKFALGLKGDLHRVSLLTNVLKAALPHTPY